MMCRDRLSCAGRKTAISSKYRVVAGDRYSSTSNSERSVTSNGTLHCNILGREHKDGQAQTLPVHETRPVTVCGKDGDAGMHPLMT